MRTSLRQGLPAAFALVAAATLLTTQAQPQAHAQSQLAVNWDYATAAATTYNDPDTPPPGANNFSCSPTATHPYPVILVNGTFANQDENWQAASPLLANHGYCVFTFNYGGTGDFEQTGDIAASAGQLAAFVTQVLTATGAAKVDLVGHSQGGMMPRYYLKFLGGAQFVNMLVALAPSNNGTTLDGINTLIAAMGAAGLPVGDLTPLCTACTEQEAGSPFLTNLNAGGDTVPGVSYTVIETKDDEVVTPYTSAFLTGPDVTNITVQDQCPLDQADHLELSNDPVALADVLNALDPAQPVAVPCLAVLPLIGPVGLVPPF
jgi:triacylglycerol esterase/lipase EstA (alpha/beta hydrolase family)